MAVATAVARVATSLHCGWLRRQRSRRGLRLGPRRLHRWATRYGCGWPTRGWVWGGGGLRAAAGSRRRQPPPTRRRTLACGGVSTGSPVLLTAGVAAAAASLLTLRGAGGATGGEAAVIELSAAAGDTSMPRTALRTLAAVEAGGGPGGPHLPFPPLLPSPPRRLVALRPPGAHLNAAAPLTAALLGVVAAALTGEPGGVLEGGVAAAAADYTAEIGRAHV